MLDILVLGKMAPTTPSAAPHSLLVVDSGIGGLSVVREIRHQMPSARIAYAADNGGFPYGALDDLTLTNRLLDLVAVGVRRFRPDLVVLACNTGSTVALGALREQFAVPFVGCVPAVKWAASVSHSNSFGLLATPATVRRPYLQDLIDRFAPGKVVVSHGAAGLAELAERKFRGEAIPCEAVRAQIQPLIEHAHSIDTVVLGCTHFGFLRDELAQVSPETWQWLDPAGAVSKQVRVVAEQRPRSGGIATDIVLFTGSGQVTPQQLFGYTEFGFTQFDSLELASQASRG